MEAEIYIKGIPVSYIVLLIVLIGVGGIVSVIVTGNTEIGVAINAVLLCIALIFLGVTAYEMFLELNKAQKYGYPIPLYPVYGYPIPAIVLEHSNLGTSSVTIRNVSSIPVLAIRVEEIVPKSNADIKEIADIARCEIVAGLGSKDTAELCSIEDLHRFIEAVDSIKISYYDVFGNRYERIFKAKWNGKLIFIPGL